MCNTVGNTQKVNTTPDKSEKVASIEASVAMQMHTDGKVKHESIHFSENGNIFFQDITGKSFRSELTKEHIPLFQIKPMEYKAHLFPDQIKLMGPQSSPLKFANVFDNKQSENKPAQIKTNLKNDKDDPWKFYFSMGFNRTKYSDTDMHLKSSRMDVTVKDFSFEERTSADYYNPKNWESAQDAFRWIDEPTNSFTVYAEKNNNILSVTAFHPKFLKERYEDKHVTGTIDGIEVDQVMPINEPFDGYNNKPGEMYLGRFENTHKQMDWQIGFGRNINLIKTENFGKLVYTPTVYAGITSGKHYDSYLKPNAYWDADGFEDKNRIQGGNVAIGNKIKYEYGKANIFVENKFTFSHLEHQFMDGKANYNMRYNATTFGLGVKLGEIKHKPKIPEP